MLDRIILEADKYGLKVVDDPYKVLKIEEALIKKKGFCPCKVGILEENICPCLEVRTHGKCHCGLFVKNQE